ncbi:IS1/IS1595 family N-terminal zinc-binding domain-containing protein [Metallosphaera javensis (ex Sakai et al. 2022)]|uniref:IS1/IS1595 family N-terminal zinc-binding domain-containing protein n=1 Tax=Metallosphaera javensis (ex Sakai et al. 2022) TaxID=2775498 RepID=UPI00258E0CDE|nr:MAG: hypothetical protein MjAS7_0842 [Metallosphaera javensis (ex Sakai et al. 2022)]
MVKNGEVSGKQFYLCQECGRKFVEGAEHRYDKSVRERTLKMHANGMSVRSPSFRFF